MQNADRIQIFHSCASLVTNFFFKATYEALKKKKWAKPLNLNQTRHKVQFKRTIFTIVLCVFVANYSAYLLAY